MTTQKYQIGEIVKTSRPHGTGTVVNYFDELDSKFPYSVVMDADDTIEQGTRMVFGEEELSPIEPKSAQNSPKSGKNKPIPVTIDKQPTNGKRQVKFVSMESGLDRALNALRLFALDDEGQVWTRHETSKQWVLIESPEVLL